MAIDVKNINCTQCGSTDVTMISESRGKCNACGSAFVVKTRIEKQVIKNETHLHIHEEGPNTKSMTVGINPRFSEEKFVREAWIDLARADAPQDIFDKDFEMVERVPHEVVVSDFEADVSYHVSVGYDREEPYTAYETYYENVPYTENGKTYYRRVAKQRPVTKYRTVTDWRPMSGTRRCSSTAYAENRPDTTLDENLFRVCLSTFNSSRGYDDVSPEIELQGGISESANKKIVDTHVKTMRSEIKSGLPGDRNQDLSITNTEPTRMNTTTYAVFEYKTKIEYNGKNYQRSTFPFGAVIIAGEKVPNKDSLAANIKKMKKAMYVETWHKTKKVTLITMALLLASILVSFIVPLYYVVIPLFLVAVAAFGYDCVKGHSERVVIKKRVDGEIEVFKQGYMEKLLERLNGKLASFGLEPAQLSDITKGEGNGL